MQAITVKYFPQTNTKPPRVQASCAAGKGPLVSIYTAGDGNYADAARVVAYALAKSLDWIGTWIPGDTADGAIVYVYAQTVNGVFTL